VILTEGANPIELIAIDLAGNITPITVNVTLDSTPPAAPNERLIFFDESIPNQVTITGDAGSVEGNTLVNIANSRSGENIQTTADQYGSFSLTISTQAADSISLIVTDDLNNAAPWLTHEVNGTAPILAVTISSPSNNAIIESEYVNVMGTLTGPANTGVTVNGIVATVSNGQYVATGVPMEDSGSTVLTVTATTPDNVPETQAISVTKGSALPIELSVSPDSGMASLEVTFTVVPDSSFDMGSMEIDVDGDGAYEILGGSIEYTWGTNIFGQSIITQATATYIYSSPGIYNAKMLVRDTQGLGGVIHVIEHPIVVQSVMGVDAGLRAIYNGMLNKLKIGDMSGAMLALTDSMQNKHESTMNEISSNIVMIESLGEISGGSMVGNLAKYVVTREEEGQIVGFYLYLIKGDDGIWRIADI
jgi:hypothetical protein